MGAFLKVIHFQSAMPRLECLLFCGPLGMPVILLPSFQTKFILLFDFLDITVSTEAQINRPQGIAPTNRP